MEDLEAASLQDVYDWFRTYYRAANAVIVIAADIGSETALERVEHYLGEHRAWAATTRTSQRFESCGFCDTASEPVHGQSGSAYGSDAEIDFSRVRRKRLVETGMNTARRSPRETGNFSLFGYFFRELVR